MKNQDISKENNCKEHARTTNESYRADLSSWQVPAIQKHIGSLNGKVFLDIGAGTIIPGEHFEKIGKPNKYYAQDIRLEPLVEGIGFLKSKGVDTSIFHKLVSDDFDFSLIEYGEVDVAWSNSLFSHLSINSISHCLKNLHPKMKRGSSYYTSMLVLPDNLERASYNWSHLKLKWSNVTSHSSRDPFHYTRSTLNQYPFIDQTGFELKTIHNYGHPIQELVEFVCI